LRHSRPSEHDRNGLRFPTQPKTALVGKRRLRGAAADTDADAAFQDAEDSRLQVRLAADVAYFEYFLATRLSD
jgi:hypothetical protein